MPISCRPLVTVFASVAAAMVFMWGKPASAAITIDTGRIRFDNVTMHTDRPIAARLYISRADCDADNRLVFSLGLTNFAGNQLQVWATDGATDCTADSARGSSAATCFMVYTAGNLTLVTPAAIPVRSIVARGADMTADCANPKVGSGTTLQQVTLYFLLMNGTAVAAGGAANWSTKLDLKGPVPPTGMTVGSGGSRLRVGWNVAINDPDVAGYRVYCEPTSSLAEEEPALEAPICATGDDVDAAVNGPAQSEGGSDDASTGADDAAAVADELCVDGGAGGAGGGTQAIDSGSAGSRATGDARCVSSLPVGEAPGPTLVPCEEVPGNQSNQATITGLTNGQRYAVAVAAYDLVGNTGPLSPAYCGSPAPVFGFPEAYQEQGGDAGAGFCSLGWRGAAGARGGIGALGVLALGLLARRRSRACRSEPRFDRVSER